MSNVDIKLEDAAEIRRKLKALGGIRLRQVAKRVVSTAMAPVITEAKASAPVGSGRLRASLGRTVGANRRGDAFSARVGTRRDFVYRDTSGQKLVSGRGKIRDKAIAKGAKQDLKTAQQYARLIEFGQDSKGRMRRKGGGAHFLENAIQSNKSAIIGTVTAELRRYVETPPA
jgi:hypothetical protein